MIAQATATGLDSSFERVIDLGGLFVFALSGALLAVKRGFDLVGVVALALVTALGGGIVRDLVLGDVPPVAFRDIWYLVVPLIAAAVVFVAHGVVEGRLARPVLVFDAVGLGLFCVAGAVKASGADVTALGVVLIGVITATGGGILRDVLANDQPQIFRTETVLYAIPATLGATAIVVTRRNDIDTPVVAAGVAIAVTSLRLLALRFEWRAPRPRLSSTPQ